jgi:hypothetical protein
MSVCYPFKLKYLNQKSFISHIEKTQFFSYKYRVYILKGFKFHINFFFLMKINELLDINESCIRGRINLV